MAAGRVEQLTAIHRINIMEFRTGLFNGDRYTEWPLKQVRLYLRNCRNIQQEQHIALLVIGNWCYTPDQGKKRYPKR